MQQGEFERLYEEHAQRLFAFLAYRTGDHALAEDLLADAFEAAYRARKRFDPRKAAAPTWLYTIALNRLRDHMRSRAAEARALERVVHQRAAGDTIQLADERDAVMRALATLPDSERECISLRFGADMTLKQIAETIGEPMTTVEGRVYRGLRRMREQLADL